MNILEIEDVIKGLPDQRLMQEAQQPTGQLPQFLVVSEIQRRSNMRKKHEGQQQEQPQGTIAQQIVGEGIAAIAPPSDGMMQAMGVQQPPAPQQQMPQQGMPPQQMPPQQPPMPQQGPPLPPPVQMQGGGLTSGESEMGNAYELIKRAMMVSGIPASALREQYGNQYDHVINAVERDLMGGVARYSPQAGPYMPYGSEFDDPALAGPGPMEEVVVTGQRETAKPVEQIDSSSGNYIPDSVNRGMTFDTGMENLFGVTQPTARREKPIEFPPLGPIKEMPKRGDVTASDLYGDQELQKGAKAFRESFSDMAQASMDEAAPTRQFIADFLSGKLAYEPESVSRAKQRDGLLSLAQDGAMDDKLPPLRNLAGEYSDELLDSITVDPSMGQAHTGDSAKVKLPTATKVDPETLNFGLREKSSEFKVGEELGQNLAEIIGDVPPSPSGASPIQQQGYQKVELPEIPQMNFADLISEQERRLQKIREESRRDAGAQALIQLGAGIAAGDLAGGLSAAGKAASQERARERAAESEISNLKTRVKMAEEQGRFDTAKALRSEAVQLQRDQLAQEAKDRQFEKTMGFKQSELAQTLKIANAKIEAEGKTEEGRALRAEINGLNDLIARMQAQGNLIDPESQRIVQQAFAQLQQKLGLGTSGFKLLD